MTRPKANLTAAQRWWRTLADDVTPEQAQARAQAMQEEHEADKAQMEVTLPGDPQLMAGSAVDVRGLGRLDGRYVITEARHDIDVASGYVSTLAMKRLSEGRRQRTEDR